MGERENVSRDDIPGVETIKEAALKALSSGRQRSFESLEREVAKLLGLSPQQERYCVSGSATPLFANRVEKARAELRKEGFVEYPDAGKVRLAETGKTRIVGAASGQVLPPQPEAQEPVSDVPLYEPPCREAPDGKKAAAPLEGGVVVFPEPEKGAKSLNLPLVLAVVGLLLCFTGVLAFAGVLCGVASLALVYRDKRRADAASLPPRRPTATLTVAACAVALGLVMSAGALAGGSQAPPQEAPDPSAVQQQPAAPAQEGELSFVVNGSGDALPASVTVLVTGTQDDGAKVDDKHEAALGKSYVLAYPAGTYVFKLDPSSLKVGESVFASDPVKCSFDGTRDQTARLSLKLDSESMAKIEAEKEAERQKAEEEAAAAKAAEEQAAAAAAEQEAAAAAAAVSGGGGGGGGDVTVYITKTGEKFHRDGCQYLKKSQIPISRSNAIAQGYGACSKCNP